MEDLSNKTIFNKIFNCMLENRWFLIIFIPTIILRLFLLGEVPNGLNQDEAFSAYEAYSLLNFGVDSHGYPFPMYFVSWGSGMNVLQSYLAIPFIAIFGATTLAIRMPQFIISIFALYVFYLLTKKLFGEKTGLISLFVLAVTPYHFMLSRWALESNLVVAFLLLGIYFFITGIENNKRFVLSALMFGLAFYSYAIAWLTVFILVVCLSLYVIIAKQYNKFDNIKYIFISIIVLAVFAVPIFLFLLVNNSYINEIVTPFFSIPKLVVSRGSEVDFMNLFKWDTYRQLFTMLLSQNDALPTNVIPKFGMYYVFSLPFVLIGFIKLIKLSIKDIKNEKNSYNMMILIAFFSVFIACCLLSTPNINRVNCIHIFSFIFLALGLAEIVKLSFRIKFVVITLVSLYIVSFGFFLSYYFTDYNNTVAYTFNPGLEESIDFAKEQSSEKIYINNSAYYPQVMYYDETDPNEYRDTVEYSNYPSAFLSVTEFKNYYFGIDYNNLNTSYTYIIKDHEREHFRSLGYNLTDFGIYSVAIYNNTVK